MRGVRWTNRRDGPTGRWEVPSSPAHPSSIGNRPFAGQSPLWAREAGKIRRRGPSEDPTGGSGDTLWAEPLWTGLRSEIIELGRASTPGSWPARRTGRPRATRSRFLMAKLNEPDIVSRMSSAKDWERLGDMLVRS